MIRVGIGLDSHRIKSVKATDESKELIIAGVKISDKFFFEADSDGDVVFHSLCNALATAIGAGSLDTWAGKMNKKGIKDSSQFLKVILKKIKDKGYKVMNVAIMVEGQQPKLEKFRTRLQASIASIIGIKKDLVGIAFTTGQNLTSFGRGKGMQAISSVLIKK